MNSLTDVEQIKVGHAQNYDGLTGCTVILAENGATAGVDVRGSAPGTRETDLLAPINTVTEVNGVLLTGGSIFGLSAAQGVISYLEEKNVGYDVEVTKVPILPAAVIFDLEIGDYKIRPDYKLGYQACQNAQTKSDLRGNVGVGLGATVGKISGMAQATKSGVGMASQQVGDLIVSSLVVVNALGEVINPSTGQILAGVRGKNGFISTNQLLKKQWLANKEGGKNLKNTTLGVVATNAKLDKTETNKVAQMAHDGLAKVIRPVHTMFDGDTIFALSTGNITADLNLIGAVAVEVTAEAVLDAVASAEATANLPAADEWR